MKKKALLFGSIPALALACGVFISNSDGPTGQYEQRMSSHFSEEQSSGIDGAYQYYHLLKGDFTKEDWQRARNLSLSTNQDRSTFNWVDQGPDNIGGRTRAIVIDRENVSHLYAGSVSGGLFESINRASTWHKVESFTSNLAVSSICQTIDGTFYVATGHQREQNSGTQNAFESGANGHGLYKSEADGSWSLIEGTEDYEYINEVVCDDVNNVIWIAGQKNIPSDQGLLKYSVGGGLVEVASFPDGACNSISLSKDGTTIIAHSTGSGPKVFISTNSGGSFTEVSDVSASDEPGLINMAGVSRIEFAISHEKVDGNYRVYASAASSQLEGIWRSANSGVTWERIAPAYDGSPGGFAPFTSGGVSGQGTYNNIITVVPGAPEKILLGGIDCYTWFVGGNWEQISQWFLSPTNPNYVHADNHEFVWDQWGRLYIGNDGGVAFSNNAGSANPDFFPANRGYNVTQFFASGVSAHGDVIGGAQDNGTKANYHTGTTYQEHKNVGGGDGFSCNISFINRNLMFGSVYYSSVYRSSDRGENGTVFYPEEFLPGGTGGCTVGAIDGSGCGQFFTNFEMWEHPNDLASTDTLRFIPSESFNEDDIVMVPSATSQTFIEYVSPIDIVFDDTLVYDDALTFDDTLVIDELTGSGFNLGLIEWEFIFGAPIISEGDSLLIHGIVDDTIIVESWSLTNHYLGTNPDKPGETVDMGDDTVVYNISWDTLFVQDPYQSWFALDMGVNNGLYMSRNALRFSATDQGWFKVAEGFLGATDNIASMEFTKDGNHLFIGSFQGRLFRLSGFNDVYSPTEFIEGTFDDGAQVDTLVDWDGNKFPLEFKELDVSFGSAPITGIASGPIDDPDYMVVTLGRYSVSGRVRECTNATGVDPTFSSLGFPGGDGIGAASAGIPCYAVIVDRDDPNRIVVGTEFGVYATETGGNAPSDWANVSGDFGNTPVYDMQQNWRTWDEGCKRPGEIYIGTHGRGIWSTGVFLNLPDDNDNLAKEKFVPNIKLFPNPVRDAGTLEFDLEANGDVTLQIFNLSGQVVNEVAAKNLQAGKNQIAFDANDLPKGTYILRLNSNSMSETTKFIKH